MEGVPAASPNMVVVASTSQEISHPAVGRIENFKSFHAGSVDGQPSETVWTSSCDGWVLSRRWARRRLLAAA